MRGSFQPVSHQTCIVSVTAWLAEGHTHLFSELDLCLTDSHGYGSVSPSLIRSQMIWQLMYWEEVSWSAPYRLLCLLTDAFRSEWRNALR